MELESGEKLIEQEITKDQTQQKEIEEIETPNEQTETVEETELEKEIQNETAYKPRHVDTETLIKGEIKQVILSEVSELTSVRALNDMSFDIKEQITSLKENAIQLLSKNKRLDKQVETSKKGLKRFEVFLHQTNEMIEMMKRNVSKLEERIKSSRVHEILKKSERQYARLELMKKEYEEKFRTESEKIDKMLSAERERTRFLKCELKREEEKLADLKTKYEELRKTNKSYDEEIATCAAKREKLAEKVAALKARRTSKSQILQNTEASGENLRQKFRSKKDNLRAKLANVEKQKREAERELEEIIQKIDFFKNEICKEQQEILRKEAELKQLLEELEAKKQDQEATIQTLIQEDEDLACRLQKLQSDLISIKEDNKGRKEMLRTLQMDYVSKCEEKSSLLDQLLKLQRTELHNLELIFTKEQIENDTKRTQFEKLQNERDTFVHTFKLAEANKIKEETSLSEKLSDLTTKYELLKSDQDKYLLEMKKKKDYKLTTTNYFEEKCAGLRQEADKAENALKNLNEENESLKVAVDGKQTLINELKSKLQTLKNDDRAILKSGLRSSGKDNNVSKKVQFNEMPFYKSATESSEASSQVLAEGASQLERSIHEWLEDIAQTVSPEK